MRYFDEYQHELKNSIIGIKKHIQGSKKSKSYTQNPYKISVDIYNFLSNHNSDLNISQKIRAFHNFYGWKAWGEVNNFGLCSGAIYRTEEYLNINPNSRTGKKRVLEGKRRIHIRVVAS